MVFDGLLILRQSAQQAPGWSASTMLPAKVLCVLKAISESMTHSIDQLGFSQPCVFPLFPDAVKRFDMGAYKSAVSLLAQSNARYFRSHSKMDVSVQTRLFFFHNYEKLRYSTQTFTFI